MMDRGYFTASRCSSIYHRGGALNGNPMPCTHRLPLDRNDCITYQLQDKENQHFCQNVPSANAHETCLMLSPLAHQPTARATCCVDAVTEFCDSCHPRQSIRLWDPPTLSNKQIVATCRDKTDQHKYIQQLSETCVDSE